MESGTRAWLVPLSLATGLAWIAGILLVATQADSDPVGPHYDAYNRLLTPALILLFASALAFRGRVKQSGAAGLMPLTIAAVGFGLYLLGNLVEFWGALLAGQVGETAAERTGTEDYWQASFPGFLIFLVGEVIVLISLIAFAVRMGRWPGIGVLTRIAAGSAGILLSAATGLWAVSPLAALVPAVLFAFAWLALARALSSDAPLAGNGLAASPGRRLAVG